MKYRNAEFVPIDASHTHISPGNILWYPNLDGSKQKAANAAAEEGRQNHPVLVLFLESALIRNAHLGKSKETSKVTVLLITTFNGRLLQEKFPASDNELRRKFLPLKCQPPNPHPDNGIILNMETTGDPPMRGRQSYVSLEPFVVKTNELEKLWNSSTAKLTTKALKTVVKQLDQRCVDGHIRMPIGIISYSSLVFPAGKPKPTNTTTTVPVHDDKNLTRGIIKLVSGNTATSESFRSSTSAGPSVVSSVSNPDFPPLSAKKPTEAPRTSYSTPPYSSVPIGQQTNPYRSYGSINPTPLQNERVDDGYRYGTEIERGQRSSSSSMAAKCCGILATFVGALLVLALVALPIALVVWLFRICWPLVTRWVEGRIHF